MDLTSLNTTDNESYLKDWLDQNLLIPYKKYPNCKPSVVCVYPSVVGYVRDYLKEEFHGFIHDVPLWTGNCDCSHRRRIDFRKLIGNTLLCVEVDEFQHKRYSEKDEEIRFYFFTR